ncbi:MAG: hypothetical protein M9936_00810 [Caldilinea sp.]|nr:hypothetical protein [Caldilinea sp.]
MEIAPTAKRTSPVAAVSIPPVVLDRECEQSKDVRYGNRTYGETSTIRSGGFHTAGHACPRTWATADFSWEKCLKACRSRIFPGKSFSKSAGRVFFPEKAFQSLQVAYFSWEKLFKVCGSRIFSGKSFSKSAGRVYFPEKAFQSLRVAFIFRKKRFKVCGARIFSGKSL